MPSGKAERNLKHLVDRLSKQFKGPKFEPHMTLFGPIPEDKEEVIRKTKAIAKRIVPFKLTLGEVDYSSTYFQCVFVRVKTSLSLLEARMNLQKTFKIDTFFMPHISLYYGNIEPEVREKIAKAIKLSKLSFKVDKLIITPATEDTSKWRHLAEIPLQG